MKKLLLIGLCFILLIVGCDKSTEPQDCLGVAGGTAVVDECGVCNGDGTSCDAVYNLGTCSTDIAEDVPAFFKKYFHCVTAKMSESGNYVNIYYNGKPPFESWYYSESNANHIEWSSQGTGYFQIPNAYIQEVDYVIDNPEKKEFKISTGRSRCTPLLYFW